MQKTKLQNTYVDKLTVKTFKIINGKVENPFFDWFVIETFFNCSKFLEGMVTKWIFIILFVKCLFDYFNSLIFSSSLPNPTY